MEQEYVEMYFNKELLNDTEELKRVGIIVKDISNMILDLVENVSKENDLNIDISRKSICLALICVCYAEKIHLDDIIRELSLCYKFVDNRVKKSMK